MATLERAVRPWSSPLALATGQIPIPSVETQVNPAVLQWGNVGTLPTPNFGVNFTVCTENWTEKKRTVKSVRITNPSDSSQYIDINRATQIAFDKTNSLNDPSTDWTSYTEANLNVFDAQMQAAFSTVDGSSSNKCGVTMNLQTTP